MLFEIALTILSIVLFFGLNIVYNIYVARPRLRVSKNSSEVLDELNFSLDGPYHVFLNSLSPGLRRLFSRTLSVPAVIVKRVLAYVGAGQELYTVLDEQLVLGGLPFSRDIVELQRLHGVSGVVNLCEEYRGPEDTYRRLGICHLYLPTIDGTAPTLVDIERAVDFIDSLDGKPVYCHCRAGRGRSTTIFVCYLVARRGMTRAEAQQYIGSKRAVSANVYQRPVVVEYEKQLAKHE
jgi:protein tyrosine phosphatase (PTP) superfamily phosphohydrolase (DUF442 family)